MLLVPLHTEAVLPHVVRAAEAAGYAGLLVVLARAAEARALHDELTEHWTSLHDVTGSLVAVLCPDPDELDRGGTSDEILSCHGMRLRHGAGLPGFASRFRDHFDHTIYESVPAEYHTDWSPFGFRAVAQMPQIAQLHRDAWTEAASRCAGYFGIAERRLPCVLLLSLWERVAVAFAVRFTGTLYPLCKELAVDLGDAPRRIDRLKNREVRLTARLRDLADGWSSPATRLLPGASRRTDAQLAPLREATEAKRAEVARRLDALRHDLHLARAAEAAGRGVLGEVRVEERAGRNGLAGWRLRIVTETEQPPLRLTRTRA